MNEFYKKEYLKRFAKNSHVIKLERGGYLMVGIDLYKIHQLLILKKLGYGILGAIISSIPNEAAPHEASFQVMY